MHVRPALLSFLIALPWLNPFAPGPSPAVVPWLVALVCSAWLVIVAAWQNRDPGTAPPPTFTERWAAPLAWALLVAGLMSSVMALLQYFGVAGELEPWVKAGKLGEAYANLRQRNQFASLTNLALVAALWLALRAPAAIKSDELEASGAAKPAGWQRLQLPALVAAGMLLAAGNAASLSRTGLLQLMMLAVLLWLWGGWRRPAQRWVVLAALAAYWAGVFALPYLAGLDMSEQGMLARLRDGAPACSSRLTLWSNVLHLIAQKPWLGWGWGELDFAHYTTLYNEPRFCEILDNAHNLPLHLAVELGVPVALIACGALVWWLWQWRPWAESDVTRQLAWGALAVIGVHSLLEYPLWYGPFQITVLVCVGLLWHPSARAAQHDALVTHGTRFNGQNRQNRTIAQWIRAPAAMLLIAFAGYAAWDYHRISQVYLEPALRDAAYKNDTLGHAKNSRLFREQVAFAELTTTPVTAENAKAVFIAAHTLLHYSPEPRVIEKAIESSVMLGLDDDALAHLARYRAAFPKEHAAWARGNADAVAHAAASASSASSASSKSPGSAAKAGSGPIEPAN